MTTISDAYYVFLVSMSYTAVFAAALAIGVGIGIGIGIRAVEKTEEKDD